jgi:integrase
MHDVDMHFHMRQWFEVLNKLVYNYQYSPDDYIFPSVTGSGTFHPGTSVSHDTIQKWLDEFADQAGIKPNKTKLTTHCLRRGGAQYRFMFAPPGKRWTLATIRWWGGWAEKEHVCIFFFSVTFYSH